jgi:Recombination directionality factor-like
MAVLDIQRRGQQIGRIRIGQQVKAANGKMRPERLDTFRFTTASRTSADAIAALFGGTVRDWEGQYEVITGKAEIGVTVPPRDQVVSQWYEMWTKGGCQRRCDSQTEKLSGKPCLCPHAEDPGDDDAVARAAHERAMLAAKNPPQACKLVTRISVMIPDLPGLGVFRLDSGSYYAATEIGDSAELMQMARDKGVFLPAILRIEQRSRVAAGQTKKYPVPVLEVLATFRDIATGAIGANGMAAQLPPPPEGQRRAIAGAPASPALEQEPAAPAADEVSAQQIADLIPLAAVREDVEKLAGRAENAGVMDEYVCTDKDADLHEELRSVLQERWRTLEAGAA